MKLNMLWSVALMLAAPFPVHGETQQPAAVEKESKPGVIRFINDFAAPPFAFVEGIENRGFEVDLGEALGEEMGRKVEWVKQVFNLPAMSATMESGRADAVLSSLSSTEERRQYFTFTRPYFRTSLSAAILKEEKDFLKNFDRRLEGAVIGVMKGTTGEKWARKNLSARTVKTYDNPDRLARGLKNNDVEVIFLDEAILNYLLSRHSYRFLIPKTELEREDYVIAVKKEDQKFKDELNAALEKLDETGVYDEIYNRWFGPARSLP